MTNIEDKIQFEGIQSMGYGIMPKAVTKDKRLSIEAKAIYAYFVSYAGAGNSAFPKLKTILEDLSISKNRFYRHRKLLIDFGYISVEAFRNEQKVIYKNVYTLHTNPISIGSTEENDSKEGVGVKMNHTLGDKMNHRGMVQNGEDKLILTKENINTIKLTNKKIDDDDINKPKNAIKEIQNLIQKNETIKTLAQELIAMSISENDILAILEFFATNLDLIKPDIIQQQLKWCVQKVDSETGISSFSAYFINGYEQRLQYQEIEVHSDFVDSLSSKLGLNPSSEDLPTVPMHNWLQD